MKIAYFGARLADNLGGPSLLVATKSVVGAFLPEAEFTLIVRAKEMAGDLAWAERYGVKLEAYQISPWLPVAVYLRRWFGLQIGSEQIKRLIRVLEEADAVMDIWGIAFADSLGSNSFLIRLTDGLHFWLAKRLGKPVIKYTADMGPFKQRWNRIFARYYLQHTIDLILARDERTAGDIRDLGVQTPTIVAADTAFLLPAESGDEAKSVASIRRHKPVIGLSVSYQAKNREKTVGSYISTMVHLVDHVHKSVNGMVLLIPNEISSGANDDARIAEKVHEQVAGQNCQIVPSPRLRAQELKGIIQQCDLVVAARYHTIVAALSLGIPTLAIGWHHKYAGVLDRFGQERWLCSIEDLQERELLEKFDALWADRQAQTEQIRRNLEPVKQLVRDAAEQVGRFIQQRTFADSRSLQ